MLVIVVVVVAVVVVVIVIAAAKKTVEGLVTTVFPLSLSLSLLLFTR